MKKINFYILIILVSVWVALARNMVQTFDPFIDRIEDGLLNDASQVPFVIAGVQTRFAHTIRLNNQADGLSDAFIFDQNVPNATFPTFREINDGQMLVDNNSVRGVYYCVRAIQVFLCR